MSSSPVPSPPPDASPTVRGLVNTGSQNLSGNKVLSGTFFASGAITSLQQLDAPIVTARQLGIRQLNFTFDIGTPGNSFVNFANSDNIWRFQYGGVSFEPTLTFVNLNTNLNMSGNLLLDWGDMTVSRGSVAVSGNLRTSGSVEVIGQTVLSGTLQVIGSTTLSASVNRIGPAAGGTLRGGANSILVLDNSTGAALKYVDSQFFMDSLACNMVGGGADGAGAVANVIDTAFAYNTAGAKLLSVRTAGTERYSFDRGGNFRAVGDLVTTGSLIMRDQFRVQWGHFTGSFLEGNSSAIYTSSSLLASGTLETLTEAVAGKAKLDTAAAAVAPTLNGALRGGTYKVTLPYTAFSDATDTHACVVATIPAKTRIKSCIADVSPAFSVPAPATDMIFGVGVTGAVTSILKGQSILVARTVGLLNSDLGASMTGSAMVQGGYIPTWTSTSGTQLLATLFAETGGALSGMTSGSVTIYVTYENLDG